MESFYSGTATAHGNIHSAKQPVVDRTARSDISDQENIGHGAITLEHISEPAGFQKLSDDWNRLQSQFLERGQQPFDWLQKAYKYQYLNDTSVELSIIVGRHEGEVSFILPLMKSYPRGINLLKLIDDQDGNSSSFIMKEHPSNKNWMNRTWWFLMSAIDFDCLSIKNVRQHSLVLAFMKEQSAVCLPTENEEFHCLLSSNLAGQAYVRFLQGQYAASGIYKYIKTLYSSQS